MNEAWYVISGKDTARNPPTGYLPRPPRPRPFLREGAESRQLIGFGLRQARYLEHPRICAVCGSIRDRRAVDCQVDAPRLFGLMTWTLYGREAVALCHEELLAAFREDAVRRCLRLGRVFGADGRELTGWRTVRPRRIAVIRSKNCPEKDRTCNVCPLCGQLFFGTPWRPPFFFCAEPDDMPIMGHALGGSLVVSPLALKEPGIPKFRGCWTTRIDRRTRPLDGFPAVMRRYADETPEIRSVLLRELVRWMSSDSDEGETGKRPTPPGTPEARICLASIHDWLLVAKIDPDDALREASEDETTPPAIRDEIRRFLAGPWQERTLLGSCLPPGRAPRFLLDRIWRSLKHRFNEKDAPIAMAHLSGTAGAEAAGTGEPAPVPGLSSPDAPCPDGPEARLLEDVLREREPFGRFTDMELWGWRRAGTALQIASLLALRAGPAGDAQEGAVEAWARTAGRWLEDVPGTLAAAFGEPFSVGGRARVHRNGREVVKDVRLRPGEDLRTFFDRIVLHDYLFGRSTPLRVLGFGRDPGGAFRLVLSQPWIPPAPAAEPEVLGLFAKCLGFRTLRGAADERATADIWWGPTEARLIPSRTRPSDDRALLKQPGEDGEKASDAFWGEVSTGGVSRPFSDLGTLVVVGADLRRNVALLGRGGRREDTIPPLGLGPDSIGVCFPEPWASRMAP